MNIHSPDARITREAPAFADPPDANLRLGAMVRGLLAIRGSGRSAGRWYELGTSLHFSEEVPAEVAEFEGWSPEPHGPWSTSVQSFIGLNLQIADAWRSDLALIISIVGFVPPGRSQRVGVVANGVRLVETLIGPEDYRDRLIKIKLPAPGRSLRLQFDLPDCASPSELGISVDQRTLGIRLRSLTIAAVDAPWISHLANDNSVLLGFNVSEVRAAELQIEHRPPLPEAVPSTAAEAISPLVPLAPSAPFDGGVVDFRDQAGASPANVYGFSHAEEHGRWMTDHRAGFEVDLAGNVGRRVFLLLLAAPFVTASHAPVITVRIGESAPFEHAFPVGEHQARILRVGPVTLGDATKVSVSIDCDTLLSPFQADGSFDQRPMAIKLGLAAIVAERAPVPAFVSGLELVDLRLVSSGANSDRISGDVPRVDDSEPAGLLPRIGRALTGDSLQKIDRLDHRLGGVEGQLEKIEAELAALKTSSSAQAHQQIRLAEQLVGQLHAQQTELQGFKRTTVDLMLTLQDAQRSNDEHLGGHTERLIGQISAVDRHLAARLGSADDRLDALLRRGAGRDSALHQAMAAIRRIERVAVQLDEAQRSGDTQLGAQLTRLADQSAAASRHIGMRLSSNEERLDGVLNTANALVTAIHDAREIIRRLDEGQRSGEAQLVRLADQSTEASRQVGLRLDSNAERLDGVLNAANGLVAAVETLEGVLVSTREDLARAVTGSLTRDAFEDTIGVTNQRLVDLASTSATQESLLRQTEALMRQSETLFDVVQHLPEHEPPLRARLSEMEEAILARAHAGEAELSGLLVSAHQKIDALINRSLVPIDDNANAVRVASGYVLVPRSDAILTLHLLELGGAYESETEEVFRRLVTPGMRIIDVGANVGAHTLTLAQLTGPSGHVFAVEPSPTVAELLRRTVSVNALGDVVEVLEVAAGAAPGEGVLHIGVTSGHSSLLALEGSIGTDEVRIAPLDDLISNVIDLVKIDAEGMELDVLSGMRNLVENEQIILIVEYGRSHLERQNVEPGEWFRAFTELGFDPLLICEGARLKPLDTSVAGPEALDGNYVFARPSSRLWTRVTALIDHPTEVDDV